MSQAESHIVRSGFPAPGKRSLATRTLGVFLSDSTARSLTSFTSRGYLVGLFKVTGLLQSLALYVDLNTKPFVTSWKRSFPCFLRKIPGVGNLDFIRYVMSL